jgi:hypothetical protein
MFALPARTVANYVVTSRAMAVRQRPVDMAARHRMRSLAPRWRPGANRYHAAAGRRKGSHFCQTASRRNRRC